MNIYCPKCGKFEQHEKPQECLRCKIPMKEFIHVEHVPFVPSEKTFHTVIADIQPYKSMQTGEMIMSRSKHREHLKKHNLIEIGNEKIESVRKPIPEVAGLKQRLWEVANSKLR